MKRRCLTIANTSNTDNQKETSNKGKARPVNETLQTKLTKLFGLILSINGTREVSDDLHPIQPAIMFDYAGHVNRIHIHVYDCGWKYNTPPSFETSFYVDDTFHTIATAEKEIDKAIVHLETLLTTINNDNDNESDNDKDKTI